MDLILSTVVRGLVSLIRRVPLPWIVRFGRAVGGLAYWVDVRHRRVAVRNLQQCFGKEKSAAEIRELARENFRRIGENFGAAARTAFMSDEEIMGVMDLVGMEKLGLDPARPRSMVFAIGHFGNFELFGRTGTRLPGVRIATTYRGLRQPAVDAVLKEMRARSGTLLFERRTEAAALMAAMRQGNIVLGLLADQNAGRSGAWLPFFGRECSTSPAPAIFALRYDCPLFTAYCFRVGPGRWRIEVGDEIPTHAGGHPRPVDDITLDVNRAFEAAIRRDPANWFWVHNRWKPKPKAKAKPVATANDVPAA